MGRKYQHDFSVAHTDVMYEKTSRTQKANTMIAVLADHFGSSSLSKLNVLDVGASTGIIDSILAPQFQTVTGIDIDSTAIDFASRTFSSQSNLRFEKGDALNINQQDNYVDIVICSQIYEHVPNASRMMQEIFRVLRPGGVCYFAAGNRLAIHEPHYHLPFLSVIPRPLAHVYIRLTGKADFYYEKHLSYWGLKSLTREFEVIDYTRKIITDPCKFKSEYMLPPGSIKHRLAKIIESTAYWLTPGYIWLLKKPTH